MSEVNVAGAKPLSQFLRMAVMAGVESAIQIRIERGDDLNARDVSGMTPLMPSATRIKPAICKLLLSAGADHDLLDRSGKTALDIAIAAGSHEAAAVLNVGSSGRIWVRTEDEKDNHAQVLISRLVGLGFAREAGKGYWR